MRMAGGVPARQRDSARLCRVRKARWAYGRQIMSLHSITSEV